MIPVHYKAGNRHKECVGRDFFFHLVPVQVHAAITKNSVCSGILFLLRILVLVQVHAENIVGAPDASGTILFSHTNAGRVRLESCTINNQGIDCALSPSTSSRDVNTAGKEKENENGGNGKDTNGKNGGTDTTHASVSQEQPCFWKRKVPRAESCSILLRGRSEFVARGVVIAGNALFEVPDGQCMEVRG